MLSSSKHSCVCGLPVSTRIFESCRRSIAACKTCRVTTKPCCDVRSSRQPSKCRRCARTRANVCL